jgi:dimeric dUTPase (all-alpha-NTP-PPase superfamily)
MYEAQQALQARLGRQPHQYESPKIASSKVIYWEHCIIDEVRELEDWLDSMISVSRTVDKRNQLMAEIRMEAIDILHFIFNIGIELNINTTDIELMESHWTYKISDGCCVSPYHAREHAEHLKQIIVLLIDLMPWKTWKTYPDVTFDEYKASVFTAYEQVLHTTLELCQSVNMDRQTIIDTYFAKNKENHARQDRKY